MRLTVMALVTVLGAGLLSGCSSADEPREGGQGAATMSPSASAAEDLAPASGEPPTPASSAGPLDEDDVPEATELGEGWETYADPGGAEAGFSGNGSFVRERQPDELVASLVPLGCPGVEKVGPVPRPDHALEATYRTPGGSPAVAVVLEYGDETAAVRAVEQLGRLRATCRLTEQTTPGSTVVDIHRADRQRIWDVRRTLGTESPAGGWMELVVREGTTVSLLAMARSESAVSDFADLERMLRAGMQSD